ncbi:DNA protecting protein DprA [Thermaerobacter marianensis DSM 12885]|uniref:DNA protecting protein DprA n=1 Tax=Thermaerobacter marianensis (strain ATCC 700841 / DSM 12885 / JCM 10246 / 7p75a) TaxID=644966 RepID=E6SJL9_THEM7|nr:DNA-processing protein DprA [Thermaerobacter marianensis]ADU51082.1 DNA protecting protein DprA [Thermaerobacter marianensis DSM 12885]
MEAALAWMALLSLPGLGRQRVRRLAARLGGPEAAWRAPEAEWLATEAAPPEILTRAAAARSRVDPRRLAERAAAAGVSWLAWEDPGYPRRLRATPDPPLILYYRGRMPREDVPWVAVVGSRRATSYGTQVAYRLAADMAAAGWVVASGLAIGIDAAAHRGALAAGGPSVAVLGHGPDRVYPEEHRALMDRMAATGWLVAEYPPGTPAEAFRFPERNRILAGLCDGVVVVEAAPRSGALVTADLALAAGRAVMAVPGPVTRRQGEGIMELLRAGAPPVATWEDVAAVLGEHGPGAAPAAPGPSGNGAISVRDAEN